MNATRVLVAIDELLKEHRYAPTWDELAERVKCSSGTVRYYCVRLQDRRLVDWIPTQKRTLHLTDLGVSHLEALREFHARRDRINSRSLGAVEKG